LVARVWCTQGQQERPSGLSDFELFGLLTRPDLRTRSNVFYALADESALTVHIETFASVKR